MTRSRKKVVTTLTAQFGNSATGESFEIFVGTIAQLRSPDGCPWDKEQTHASIARNMIEEAYEAIDAIDREDAIDLREELGDVLLQVVLQSQMASEAGAFSITDVINDVNEKIIRRHPHVFGDEAAFTAAHLTKEQIEDIKATKTPEQVLELWDRIKLLEKQQKAEQRAAQKGEKIGAVKESDGLPNDPPNDPPGDPPNDLPEGLLDGIPQSLPALMQAQDISRKAVSAGFEWPDVASVWEQVFSEIEEFRAEEAGSSKAETEFGDVLFSLVNVARKEGIDAESALRCACRKFRQRWAIMEESAEKDKKHISAYSTDELERLWQDAKKKEQGQL